MLNEIRDVRASMWIFASAGTGKTKSLIDRILALLLSGAAPSSILCLTYTKAAASEMLARLSNYLYRWHNLSRNDLSSELEEMGFGPQYIEIAQNLYKAANSANWVQIKTIHSFCLSLLEQFPLETGLFPNISVCDDYQYNILMNEAISAVISNDIYQRDLENIAEFECDISEFVQTYGMKIKHFIDQHDDFRQLFDDYFDAQGTCDSLSDLEELLFEKIFAGRHTHIFAELAEGLYQGSSTDIKKAQILERNSHEPSAEFVSAFLNKQNEVFKTLCTSKVQHLRPRMEEVSQLAETFVRERNKISASIINSSFFRVIKAVYRKFEELKSDNHCIDYNDVILNALLLLDNIDWVMYKTDSQLHHLLVDEAQDTSPEQWEIIRKITGEFFNHQSSGKTVFVVGDEKQSIYSFQGANVKLFNEMHSYFKQIAQQSGSNFYDIELSKSYRTQGKVLAYVDHVFEETFNVKHQTNREEDAGVVEIVDLFQDDDANQTSEQQIANYIANYIKHALDTHVMVGKVARPAQPSDFLILFQRRKRDMMKRVINTLRSYDIPVSGIDRVSIKEELVVEDLVALAEFAVFPLDDLMCARVLKSPIVGMTEEDLMTVCLDRADSRLWLYLQRNEEMCRRYPLARLQEYIAMAHNTCAYDFFMRIFVDGTIENIIKRLGRDSLDTVSEFLNIVNKFDQTPSVHNFLRWFRSFDHEIKKDSFSNKNMVRLMTAHASKGLQAPFVILADCHFVKSPQQIDKILLDEKTGVLCWNYSTSDQPQAVLDLYDQAKVADHAESDRLLYVAMTRAENYLCVLAKANKRNKLDEHCWYSKLSRAQSICEEREEGGQKVWQFGQFAYIPPTEDSADLVETETKQDVPHWFFEKLPLPQPAEQNHDSHEIIYGNFVHLLLSELPKYCKDEYDAVYSRCRLKFSLEDTIAEAALKEARAVLEKYPQWFHKNSYPEVGFVFQGQEGRIDRVIQLENETIIIDFKTGQQPHDIPASYRKQLEWYRQAWSSLNNLPASQVKTILLWTRSLAAVEVED